MSMFAVCTYWSKTRRTRSSDSASMWVIVGGASTKTIRPSASSCVIFLAARAPVRFSASLMAESMAARVSSSTARSAAMASKRS